MRIILPGDKISDKPVRTENTVVDDGKTYATVIGLQDESQESFIPLETVWYPRQGDFVVGVVENVRNNVSTVNLSSPFKGLILPPRRPPFGRGRGRFGDRGGRGGFQEEERQEILNVGDVISAFVREVKRESDQIIMILERPRKLFGGKMMVARPSKVPRIIGRANTMVKQLEQGTKCTVLVGLNGVIWMKGGNIPLAMKAINKIQDEAHVSGLTERINKMLASGS